LIKQTYKKRLKLLPNKEIFIMELKNGYKVIYEVAADGKRTFYASKSNAYPAADDVVIASFNDVDYIGKVIYEYKGDFYVSTGSVPAYNKDGVPTDKKIEGFDQVFKKADAVQIPTGTVLPQTEAYVNAISTNGDSHGELTIDGNIVTLKVTGEIKPATNPNGNTYHHVGFKITAPEGIDPANVKITRPDGKIRVMSKILDGANFANMYWQVTETERLFTYSIDWNGDGVNELTVAIDANEAELIDDASIAE
jgi:hypothetical protein